MEDIEDTILCFSDISQESKSISSNGTENVGSLVNQKMDPNAGSKRIITFGPNAIGIRTREALANSHSFGGSESAYESKLDDTAKNILESSQISSPINVNEMRSLSIVGA